jgi:DNA-binding IscR family transcriptional regulator
LVKGILNALSGSGLIIKTAAQDETAAGWQPARDINSITVASVLEALDKNGVNALPVKRTREFDVMSDAVNAAYAAIRNSPADVALKDI